ncbi:hypothetical protein GVI19_04070 [Escherichia coli]|uniref:helix-turn-helix domain-containing protein n=1 Tax=Escherichia coli TaxID=562 RepID=UPI0018848DE4|nr:helix-turn-helix domain-containing protein [Escherichia coli]MBE9762321.1 hypothetical protein [Escherichia coli]
MTELEKTEVQRTPDEAYGVAEMRFLCASRILIRSTGEVVKITPVMKLAYQYMRNQYIGFSSRGQQFYTDQRQMAAALDVSRDTFSKVLTELKSLGIVESAGWRRNSEAYTVHFFSDVADALEVIHKEYKGAPAWDHERANKNFKSKSKMKKTAQPKIEESENGVQQQNHEQPTTVASETAAPVAGKPNGVPVMDVPVDVELSGGDDAVNASTQYTDEQLRTKLRKWRNWGLDEEAKAFCLSHGISNDEDSMNLFIQNYLIPVPASVEQQVNAPDDYSPPDFDDDEPF